MGVSHIADVESIILYLYFQINKFVKGFHPLLWSRKSMCLSQKKIIIIKKSVLNSVVRSVICGYRGTSKHGSFPSSLACVHQQKGPICSTQSISFLNYSVTANKVFSVFPHLLGRRHKPTWHEGSVFCLFVFLQNEMCHFKDPTTPGHRHLGKKRVQEGRPELRAVRGVIAVQGIRRHFPLDTLFFKKCTQGTLLTLN